MSRKQRPLFSLTSPFPHPAVGTLHNVLPSGTLANATTTTTVQVMPPQEFPQLCLLVPPVPSKNTTSFVPTMEPVPLRRNTSAGSPMDQCTPSTEGGGSISSSLREQSFHQVLSLLPVETRNPIRVAMWLSHDRRPCNGLETNSTCMRTGGMRVSLPNGHENPDWELTPQQEANVRRTFDDVLVCLSITLGLTWS